ncbi:hypothetical protein IIB79_01975 [candidate division KSB1 bacterium]|nr:hypothetical protein [candidate division KSB1 bacterium]
MKIKGENKMNNSKKIQALRDCLDFVEKAGIDINIPWKIHAPCESAEEFSAKVKKLGSFDKKVDDSFLNAEKWFGDGTQCILQVYVLRTETCKRIVVGKKTVPFKAAETLPEVPEHEEDIVKWECPESFLDIKKETVSV